MLYFDINKTLIASDKATHKKTEDVLNELLSEKYSYRWNDKLEHPITYVKYVEEILLPGEESPYLKNKQRKYLDHFLKFLKETKNPLYPTVLHEFNDANSILEKNKDDLFPSFYKLLEYLKQNKIPYALFIRSFGKEIPDVVNKIEARTPIIFHLAAFKKGVLVVDKNTFFNTPKEAYLYLKTHAPMAIQDDWLYWSKNKGESQYGKPFYIDPKDTETISIFFDDNITPYNSQKNIIAPIDITTSQLLPIEPLIKSEEAVPVDTLEAITDDDYFIKKVEQAMEIRGYFIKSSNVAFSASSTGS